MHVWNLCVYDADRIGFAHQLEQDLSISLIPDTLPNIDAEYQKMLSYTLAGS